jgi:hypothetical protein
VRWGEVRWGEIRLVGTWQKCRQDDAVDAARLCIILE